MNLKLRRLIRTPYSEQYALFDLDASAGNRANQENGDPPSIGKLDLHFTDNGVFGTILIWDSVTATFTDDQRGAFIEALLSEISQPMGMPDSFAVEFFSPNLDTYNLYHNIGHDNEDGA
ncbi:MAG: hypothetical protein U9R25_18045 [Chloroflexota bacterium]|nr:hypothetical protein [Chloroflexota bacterium]